ncbi:hypothetical protein [Hyphomicrobium sp.]|uniref:hypothetical protein n=1 Tax=Hyphomicrobium sp. TaxID=82 RepID=UPI000FBC3C82|nr:hypothetical protein [Hyphomicrobium sp.]RUO97993.1 MAG: hypothetical protein EKK30_14815 [Hyphomicrobium sp.]
MDGDEAHLNETKSRLDQDLESREDVTGVGFSLLLFDAFMRKGFITWERLSFAGPGQRDLWPMYAKRYHASSWDEIPGWNIGFRPSKARLRRLAVSHDLAAGAISFPLESYFAAINLHLKNHGTRHGEVISAATRASKAIPKLWRRRQRTTPKLEENSR